MSVGTIFLVVFVFTVLTVTDIKGYDFVRRKSPDNLVRFYFIITAVRFLFAVTMVGIYTLFSDDREDTLHFAALILVLYTTMIVVSLITKHRKK